MIITAVPTAPTSSKLLASFKKSIGLSTIFILNTLDATSFNVLFVIDSNIELDFGVIYSPLVIVAKLLVENSSTYLFSLASN